MLNFFHYFLSRTLVKFTFALKNRKKENKTTKNTKRRIRTIWDRKNRTPTANRRVRRSGTIDTYILISRLAFGARAVFNQQNRRKVQT